MLEIVSNTFFGTDADQLWYDEWSFHRRGARLALLFTSQLEKEEMEGDFNSYVGMY
jgi:hypothetical protein